MARVRVPPGPAPQAGERVLDLGSGSGTDSFSAATLVGPTGDVTGVEMTEAQLAKAEGLCDTAGLDQVHFVEALRGPSPAAADP